MYLLLIYYYLGLQILIDTFQRFTIFKHNSNLAVKAEDPKDAGSTQNLHRFSNFFILVFMYFLLFYFPIIIIFRYIIGCRLQCNAGLNFLEAE